MNQRCEWCGFVGAPIEAHGHGSCQQCKNNISPCCEGENIKNDNLTRLQEGMKKDCLTDEHILD